MFRGVSGISFCSDSDPEAVATLWGPLNPCGDEAFKESVTRWVTDLACFVEPRAVVTDGRAYHVEIKHAYGNTANPGHTFVVVGKQWTHEQRQVFRVMLLAMAELYDWDFAK